MDNIETLLERLGSLKIMSEASSKTNEWSDKEISVVLALTITNDNIQAIMPKSIVPDPVWFNGDWIKFEDW